MAAIILVSAWSMQIIMYGIGMLDGICCSCSSRSDVGEETPPFHLLHGMHKISAFSFTSSHALLYLHTILANILGLCYVMLGYKDGCGVARKARQNSLPPPIAWRTFM
jgi:hypothetical protein